MNNSQVTNIRVNDFIQQTTNGTTVNYVVQAVRKTGVCVYERSKACGHAYACLTLRYQGSDLVVETSIRSDEYIQGEGFRVFNDNGDRLTGWTLTGHDLTVETPGGDAPQSTGKDNMQTALRLLDLAMPYTCFGRGYHRGIHQAYADLLHAIDSEQRWTHIFEWLKILRMRLRLTDEKAQQLSIAARQATNHAYSQAKITGSREECRFTSGHHVAAIEAHEIAATAWSELDQPGKAEIHKRSAQSHRDAMNHTLQEN